MDSFKQGLVPSIGAGPACRFLCLDRARKGNGIHTTTDAWHSGKTGVLDGTKECVSKKPPKGGFLLDRIFLHDQIGVIAHKTKSAPWVRFCVERAIDAPSALGILQTWKTGNREEQKSRKIGMQA